VRDAMKIQLELLLMAEVQTTALIMCGTTETPERTNAITKGDCFAVPVEMVRSLSLYGLEVMVRYFVLVLICNGLNLHNESNNENTENIEDKDSNECLPGSVRDELARILSLSACNGHDLDVTETESRSQKDFPECKEPSCRSCIDILHERARVSPVVKAETLLARGATKVNDDAANDQTNNEHDLERCENNLGLSDC